MEAAAATLLVVVPAKPWRAKQRLAAARINCRRRSPVMRRVLMVVSKHSPPANVKDFAAVHHESFGLDRPKPQAAADAGQDEAAIATGEHALQVGAVDLDAGKARPARDILHGGRKGFDIGHGRDRAAIGDPASPGNTDEV